MKINCKAGIRQVIVLSTLYGFICPVFLTPLLALNSRHKKTDGQTIASRSKSGSKVKSKNEAVKKHEKKEEIVTKVIFNERGARGVMAEFEIAGSKKEVWKMLTDYKNFKKIFHNIKRLDVLSKNRKGASLEYWINTFLSQTHYVLKRKYNKKYAHFTWERVSGDMKTISGSWRLKKVGQDKVKLTYQCYVVADGALAGVTNWFIENWAQAETRKMAKSLIKYMRQVKKEKGS